MKKITQKTKVAKLMEINPLLKPKEIAQRLKMSVKQVYVLRNAIKKSGNPVSKVTNKVTDNTKYIRALEVQVHELEKLHDGWRQNYKKLEADYTQAKIMYLNSQAVVTYLEEKVAQLIKG
jgi:hypothetical protein